jgi:hypothetical protein
MLVRFTAKEDASALASVAVVGRERRAAADAVVKDVEAWSPFSQPSWSKCGTGWTTALFADFR